MAGLTAAAYRQAGLKVVLCEKEKHTGGLVNSFEYKGFVFDGGIRAIEDSGIVMPMLRQLGVQVDFLPNPVIRRHWRRCGQGFDSKECLGRYQELLNKYFPDNQTDIAAYHPGNRERSWAIWMCFMALITRCSWTCSAIRGMCSGRSCRGCSSISLTTPKIARLQEPVETYLARLSDNQALIDMIAQHFFQQTPTHFALSYFSLYLDYRYPRGGTGKLPQALERFVLDHGGEIRAETRITSLDPGRHQATDDRGNVYQYKRLVWAADQQALYRMVNPASVPDRQASERIQARKAALVGKVGGDSVLTVYVAADLESGYFARIASPHFFYTPSTVGLSQVKLAELRTTGPEDADGLTADRPRIEDWLRRYLEYTTYEIAIPALRDSTLAPAGKTGLIISTLFDYSLTRHIEALGWYEQFKKLVADRMIEVLDASIYPGLKAAVIDSFASTPLTIEKISGNSEGAITGWAFTNDFVPAVSSLLKVASSVLTPIPDIYQAGQWTYSPAGLPISILTGKLAADRVLKDLG